MQYWNGLLHALPIGFLIAGQLVLPVLFFRILRWLLPLAWASWLELRRELNPPVVIELYDDLEMSRLLDVSSVERRPQC